MLAVDFNSLHHLAFHQTRYARSDA